MRKVNNVFNSEEISLSKFNHWLEIIDYPNDYDFNPYCEQPMILANNVIYLIDEIAELMVQSENYNCLNLYKIALFCLENYLWQEKNWDGYNQKVKELKDYSKKHFPSGDVDSLYDDIIRMLMKIKIFHA